MVPHQELDLAVGDIFQVGDTTVTVIDIDRGEVTFRIDDGDSLYDDRMDEFAEIAPTQLPR